MLKSKRFRTHLGIVGILLSFAVFSINSGIPKEDDSQRPYFSGYWIGQLRGLSDLYASSDHQHSWAWADRGLSLVDGGNISHPHEIKDLTTASVNEVWETADPNHAWVLCRKDSPWELYLAGMDGSAGRIGLPKEPDRSPNPVLARSARFVWVSPYVDVPSNGRAVRARSLYVVMDDGTVKIVKTNALDSFTIESSSQFHLLGDGSRALITDEHGTSWFLVGIDGTDKKITPPSFKGRTIFSEYPVADTNRTLFFTAPTPSEAELEESPITFLLRSFKDMGSHLKPNDNHKLKRDNTTILAVNSEGDAHEITFPVVASLTGHTLSPRGHYLWSILEEEKVQHIYLTDLQKGSSTELTLPPHPFFKIPILNNERIFPNEESRQAVFTDFPKTDFYLLNAEKSPVELIRVSLGSEYKGIFDWQIANTHAFLMAKPDHGAPVIAPLLNQSLSAPHAVLTIANWSSERRDQLYSGGQFVWIAHNPDSYVLGLPDNSMHASLRSQGTVLETSQQDSRTIKTDATSFSLEINLPSMVLSQAPGARVSIRLFGTDGRRLFSSPIYQVANSENRWRFNLPATWAQSLDPSAYYRLEATVSDDYGTDLTITWPRVKLVQPDISLFERKWVRSVIVYLILLIIVVALLRTDNKALSLRRFIPLAAWVLSSGAALMPRVTDFLDGPLLVILLGGTLLLAVPSALWSPPMFRAIIAAEPFHWLAPLALSIPKVRGRIFNDYVRQIESDLTLTKEYANNESYAVLPAQIVFAERGGQVAGSHMDEDPAATICRVLISRNQEELASVLIQAPSGRGKSALLREVVRQSIDEFRKNPALPLPLLCVPGPGGIEAIALKSLGRHAVLKDQIGYELRAGLYFLVFDGLTESQMDSEVLSDYLKGEYGGGSPILASSRPNEVVKKAIRSADRCLIVEPLRLDEKSLRTFIKAYLKDEAATAREPELPISSQILKACQGRDGTYLPILVRLALKFGDASVFTVSDLYMATLNQMFQSNSSGSDTKNEVPIEEAADLCVSTYWRSQVRSIAYSAANTSDKLILRQLVVAGVLVAANPRQESVAIDPDEVRFFHDSMQSYLTARGLFRTDKRWDALFRAAGDPGFVSAQSDILTVIGSELFQMCVAVYRPREALRQQLRGHLLLWAKRHGGDLTKNNVIRGLPERILSDPMWTVEERDNAQSLLTKAVQLCTVVDTQSDDASCLSAMYAEIAPIIWTFPNAQDGLDFGLS